MARVLVSLSGGVDSSTLLGLALSQKHEVCCICFDYGSKHGKYEQESAGKISEHYGVGLDLVSLKGVFEGSDSSLVSQEREIPHGLPDDNQMRSTVVPGRNLVFLSLLSSIALAKGHEEIWLGVHGEDRITYPDCRQEFLKAFQTALTLGTERTPLVKTPFLFWMKHDLLREGLKMGVPYLLTRTCYKAQEIACGKCSACQGRLIAFKINNTKDPVEYERGEENDSQQAGA